MAFKIAGSMAIKEAVMKATRPVRAYDES